VPEQPPISVISEDAQIQAMITGKRGNFSTRSSRMRDLANHLYPIAWDATGSFK